MAIDPLGAVIDTLATHLTANISGIQSVMRSWPDPRTDIAYPSISIVTAQPVARMTYPELLRQEENDPVDDNVICYYRVGKLTTPLQLDIWAQSATERGEYQQKAIEAICSNVENYSAYPSYRNESVASLQMANYYNFYCQYSLRGMQWNDTEDSAERREFRAQLNVEAVSDIVIVRNLVKMTALDLDWRVGPETIEQLANMPSEIQIIF